MIPTIRSGARAINLSGWLATFHPDKYNSLGAVDAGQTSTPNGLYGTCASIWGADVPSEPIPRGGQMLRDGFTDRMLNTQGANVMQSPYLNVAFNYPSAVQQQQQQELAYELALRELTGLSLDTCAAQPAEQTLPGALDGVMEPALESTLDPALLEAVLCQQQTSQSQVNDMQTVIEEMQEYERLQQLAHCNCIQNCNCGSGVGLQYEPGLGVTESLAQSTENLVQSAVKDPGKYLSHFGGFHFQDMLGAVHMHLCNAGPVPDVSLFHLFRKVQTQAQLDKAISLLMEDKAARNAKGVASPYSEVTSAAVFNALNRAGGDEFVVAAAERAGSMGLSLSRSNMYHLMKQYSVQGKVQHVERLFRALERAGKSWNSNCIVIMMLAYFNQGKFEEADLLRRELKARGIKISERIDARLDKLLLGEETWRWEDKVWARPKRGAIAGARIGHGGLFNARQDMGLFSNPYMNMTQSQAQRMYHTSPLLLSEAAPEDEGLLQDQQNILANVSLKEAVKDPKLHLNALRIAGFDELFQALHSVLEDTSNPLENVCISFLFRKVEARAQVERAMELLAKDRVARKNAGVAEEYNETTCSRIFNALFRTGASDLALEYAETAKESGLLLSGKALHELLKSFAIKNDVDKVEEIWQLVKQHGKPSSRIVYSIFRTYFDNHMMERAENFRAEIGQMNITLSQSATRNIEEVLSGSKQWVKDPHNA